MVHNPRIRAKRVLLPKIVAEAEAEVQETGGESVEVGGLDAHHRLQRGPLGLFHQNVKVTRLSHQAVQLAKRMRENTAPREQIDVDVLVVVWPGRF